MPSGPLGAGPLELGLPGAVRRGRKGGGGGRSPIIFRKTAGVVLSSVEIVVEYQFVVLRKGGGEKGGERGAVKKPQSAEA